MLLTSYWRQLSIDDVTAPAPLTGISLPILITGVTTARADVLDQLGEAMVVAEHLDRVGDDLIGHFVAQARNRGISWSRIGERMGVSKQAAQQRFRPGPDADPLPPLDASQGFARFTVAARNVLGAAHEAARAGGRAVVTPADLAGAALVHSGDRLGIAAPDVERALAPILAAIPLAEQSLELLPYDDRAQAVLVESFAQAVRLDAPFVDVPHLLLAVLATEGDDGPLHQLGVTVTAVGALR
jgi:hypothetical protein